MAYKREKYSAFDSPAKNIEEEQNILGNIEGSTIKNTAGFNAAATNLNKSIEKSKESKLENTSSEKKGATNPFGNARISNPNFSGTPTVRARMSGSSGGKKLNVMERLAAQKWKPGIRLNKYMDFKNKNLQNIDRIKSENESFVLNKAQTSGNKDAILSNANTKQPINQALGVNLHKSMQS